MSDKDSKKEVRIVRLDSILNETQMGYLKTIDAQLRTIDAQSRTRWREKEEGFRRSFTSERESLFKKEGLKLIDIVLKIQEVWPQVVDFGAEEYGKPFLKDIIYNEPHCWLRIIVGSLSWRNVIDRKNIPMIINNFFENGLDSIRNEILGLFKDIMIKGEMLAFENMTYVCRWDAFENMLCLLRESAAINIKILEGFLVQTFESGDCSKRGRQLRELMELLVEGEKPISENFIGSLLPTINQNFRVYDDSRWFLETVILKIAKQLNLFNNSNFMRALTDVIMKNPADNICQFLCRHAFSRPDDCTSAADLNKIERRYPDSGIKEVIVQKYAKDYPTAARISFTITEEYAEVMLNNEKLREKLPLHEIEKIGGEYPKVRSLLGDVRNKPSSGTSLKWLDEELDLTKPKKIKEEKARRPNLATIGWILAAYSKDIPTPTWRSCFKLLDKSAKEHVLECTFGKGISDDACLAFIIKAQQSDFLMGIGREYTHYVPIILATYEKNEDVFQLQTYELAELKRLCPRIANRDKEDKQISETDLLCLLAHVHQSNGNLNTSTSTYTKAILKVSSLFTFAPPDGKETMLQGLSPDKQKIRAAIMAFDWDPKESKYHEERYLTSQGEDNFLAYLNTLEQTKSGSIKARFYEALTGTFPSFTRVLEKSRAIDAYLSTGRKDCLQEYKQASSKGSTEQRTFGEVVLEGYEKSIAKTEQQLSPYNPASEYNGRQPGENPEVPSKSEFKGRQLGENPEAPMPEPGSLLRSQSSTKFFSSGGSGNKVVPFEVSQDVAGEPLEPQELALIWVAEGEEQGWRTLSRKLLKQSQPAPAPAPAPVPVPVPSAPLAPEYPEGEADHESLDDEEFPDQEEGVFNPN